MKAAGLADYLYRHPFPRFCLVGGVGFVVDATLLMLLHRGAGLSVMAARLLSFAVALTVTWLLNRLMTFRHAASRRKLPEWQRYVAVNGTGGALNLVIFFCMTRFLNGIAAQPLPALVTASLVALLFNYTGSRLLVFNARREAP